MQRAWQELKKGWQEAGWGDYFVLALFPVVIVTALLAWTIDGRLYGSAFWGLTVLVLPIVLFWVGLESGLTNWLGRLVFAIALLSLALLLIKKLVREGRTEDTVTRTIGRYRVTIPVRVEEAEPQTISRPAPSWWQRSRRAFETISAAFHTAAQATWTH